MWVSGWGKTMVASLLPKRSMLFHREMSSEIFVSRMSHYTTDEDFYKAFSKFGIVKDVRLIKDMKTRRPKGFGFVTYDSEAEAQNAVKGMDKRWFVAVYREAHARQAEDLMGFGPPSSRIG